MLMKETMMKLLSNVKSLKKMFKQLNHLNYIFLTKHHLEQI